MPTVITAPVTVAAAGEPPKTIREYIGRASTDVVRAGEAIAVSAGERVRDFTPAGAEHLAVCVPAFAPDSVHREDEG